MKKASSGVRRLSWPSCAMTSSGSPIWAIVVARAFLFTQSALWPEADAHELRTSRIIRGTDYIFRSEEQQHSFNYPVQAGTNSKDTPEKDGQRFTVKVQKNDVSSSTPLSPLASYAHVQAAQIVILSSDGLVDNLFDEDILEEVLRFTDAQPEPYHETSFAASSFRAASSSFASAFSSLSSPSSSPSSSDPDSTPPSTPEHSEPAPPKLTLDRFSPQAVSEALCSRAKAVSEDQRAVTSPFAQRAMEEGIHFVGGKNDDISVLVAVVGDQEVRLLCQPLQAQGWALLKMASVGVQDSPDRR